MATKLRYKNLDTIKQGIFMFMWFVTLYIPLPLLRYQTEMAKHF